VRKTTRTKTLDREQEPLHILFIVARDEVDHETTGMVSIQVLDRNDHCPQFTTKQFNLKIKVCDECGSQTNLKNLYAVDRDQEDNAQRTYEIVSGDSFVMKHFVVETINKEGILLLITCLDVDAVGMMDIIKFEVGVTDVGCQETERSANAEVIIEVEDC
jgi:hypothetical protein